MFPVIQSAFLLVASSRNIKRSVESGSIDGAAEDHVMCYHQSRSLALEDCDLEPIKKKFSLDLTTKRDSFSATCAVFPKGHAPSQERKAFSPLKSVWKIPTF